MSSSGSGPSSAPPHPPESLVVVDHRGETRTPVIAIIERSADGEVGIITAGDSSRQYWVLKDSKVNMTGGADAALCSAVESTLAGDLFAFRGRAYRRFSALEATALLGRVFENGYNLPDRMPAAVRDSYLNEMRAKRPAGPTPGPRVR